MNGPVREEVKQTRLGLCADADIDLKGDNTGGELIRHIYMLRQACVQSVLSQDHA